MKDVTQGNGKSYYVLHVRLHGFWIVCCNDNGHYRQFGRYHTHKAAVNVAMTLNQQSSEEYTKHVFASVGAA